MLQLTPSQNIASDQRPVALRMRSDLIVRERMTGARKYFIVKDPLQLTHHQLWEEEFALLRMLDGVTSVEQMKVAFQAMFPRARLDSRRLQILHGQFHRNGLVLAETLGQAAVMQRRQEELRSQRRWSRIRGWLSIRFRGINPSPFLDFLDRRVGWIFELTALRCIALFIMLTATFFVTCIPQFFLGLSSIGDHIHAQSIVLIYLAFSGLKVLHEIGHGLACKHYGGECNEMGVMLLVFTPCLYCNVTDSWMVDCKWKRAMIASAGVLFEWIAASVCFWVWWFSAPGILNDFCLYVILIGSVGTLVFNGNPLMKYDGYFVLSDLLDRPNLAQQAQHALRNQMARLYLKNSPATPSDYSGRSDRALGMYGLLSLAYRWAIGVMVLLVVYKLFQAIRLEIVGGILVFTLVAAGCIRLVTSAFKFANTPGRLRNLRTGRISLSVLAAMAIAVLTLWVPLPARLYSYAYLEAQNSKSVYVIVDGTLLSCLPEGTIVRAGDEIATLDSPELKLHLAARQGELSRQRTRLIGLESRRSEDPIAASKIPTVQEAIEGLELEVRRLEANLRQLTLRAPMDGLILAPISVKTANDSAESETWSGSPMDDENHGCFMVRGTKLCDVGEATGFQGTVYLAQDQVELVRPGQAITVKSETLPNHSFHGVIAQVGTASHHELPPEFAAAGIIPVRTNRFGKLESKDPVFAAKIEISRNSHEKAELLPLHRSIGTITIEIAPQSLASRFARFVFSSFEIDPTVQQRASL